VQATGLVVRCEVLAPRLQTIVPGRSGARTEARARCETRASRRAACPVAGTGAETGSVARGRPLAGARGTELPRRSRRPGVVRLPLTPRGARGVSLPAGRSTVEIWAGARAETAGSGPARTKAARAVAAGARAGEAATRPIERARALETPTLRTVAAAVGTTRAALEAAGAGAAARTARTVAARAEAAGARPFAAGLVPAGVVVPWLVSMVRQVSFRSFGSAAEHRR
jgi:hypothetical protein